MQKLWVTVLLCCLLFAGLLSGCGGEAPAETEQDIVAEEEPRIEAGIDVSGTVVKAAGKSIDLSEKNQYIRAVARCRWLEKNKLAIECITSSGRGQDLYLAVYDVVRDIYVYEQYGKQFIWQNDDLDTLIYVVDYSEAEEPSQVRNKNDVVLYESGSQEQIENVSYVPKGIKVELTDLHGSNPRQIVVEAAS